jgi:hypothetical protein
VNVTKRPFRTVRVVFPRKAGSFGRSGTLHASVTGQEFTAMRADLFQRITAALFVVLAVTLARAGAGAATAPGSPRDALEALEELREGTGRPWRATWDRATGLPATLEGGASWAYPGTPRQAAEMFVDDYPALFGADRRGVTLTYVGEVRNHDDGRALVQFTRRHGGADAITTRVTLEVAASGRVRSMRTARASVGTVERDDDTTSSPLPPPAFLIPAASAGHVLLLLFQG